MQPEYADRGHSPYTTSVGIIVEIEIQKKRVRHLAELASGLCPLQANLILSAQAQQQKGVGTACFELHGQGSLPFWALN